MSERPLHTPTHLYAGPYLDRGGERRKDPDWVAAAFDATFAPHFTMKRVPRAKMDAEYSVDAISIVVMKRRHAPPAGGAVAVAVDDDAVKVKPPEEE